VPRLVPTLLCLLGLLAVGLVGIVATLDYDQRTRGMTLGFPDPLQPYLPIRPAVGVNVDLGQYDDVLLQDHLSRIEHAGFTWVRQTFAWSRIEPMRGQFDWNEADRLVKAISATPLSLIAVLDTSPTWAVPSGVLQPPANSHDFVTFARALALRYGDRVDYYQIWDEPNLGARWNGEVNPVAYAEMLRQARDAIRTADPSAVILLAGLAPTVETSSANMADWLFLRKLYEAGAQDYFDVAAGKPYGFDTGPDDRRVDPGVLNFSHLVLMREEMTAHGDSGKALWASHFGWNTHPQSIWGHATPEQQLQWTQDAVRRARDEWPWLGVMIVENWAPAAARDDPLWGFSIADKVRLVESAGLSPAFAGYHPAAVPIRPGSAEYVANPLARFEGAWRFGESGADGSATSEKASLAFSGDSIALHVRRAADRANLYVTIDGAPANALPHDERGSYLQLIPPVKGEIDLAMIPIATGLSDGVHRLDIVTQRGWNQWSLIGWSVSRQVDRAALNAGLGLLATMGVLLVYGALRNARRTEWGALGASISSLYSRLGQITHIVVTVFAAIAFYASAWLAWGGEAASAYRRLGDPANVLITLAAATVFSVSPWIILTVITGVVLTILIALRLDLGLMLVAFFAPFFLLPANLFYRFSSMVEMTLGMCLLAWSVRRLHAWRVSRAQSPRIADRMARFTSLDWSVLALFVFSTLSLMAASYFEFALREWRIVLLEPCLFYMLLRSARLDRAARQRIVDALVLAAIFVAVIGLVQYAFNLNLITAEEGVRRLRSVYGSPNNVALFLGRVLPIALAFALLGRGRRRWLYAIAIAPLALAIALSQSRGAIFVGLPASILAIGLLAGGRWLWTAVGTLAIGALAAIPFLNTPRFQALLGGEGTQVFRVALWRSTLNLIRDHPILGVGPDNFLYAYRGRYLLPEAWQESSLSHPHNVVLDFAARLGLLGLAAFVWIQVAFWRAVFKGVSAGGDSRRLDRALAIGLAASMIDFLAHGLVDAAYFVVDLAFVFMLTLASIQGLNDEVETVSFVQGRVDSPPSLQLVEPERTTGV